MRKLRIPIFYRLFVTYILCSILPLFIIGGLMYGLSLNFLNRTLNDQTLSSVETFHDGLHERIAAYKNMIIKIQNSSQVSDTLSQEEGLVVDVNAIYETMYEVMVGEQVKPVIHIIDTKGQKTYTTDSFPDNYLAGLNNRWGIFREIDNEPGDLVIYPGEMNYRMTGKTVISLGGKIYNKNNEHVGYVIVDVPKLVLLEEMNVFNSGLFMHMVMVDENGYTLLDTENSSMEGKFQQASYLDEEKIKNHTPINAFIGYEAFLLLEVKDDVLGTMTKVRISSTIFQAFNRILTLILVIGSIVSLLFSVFLALAQARAISNPINQLIKTMGEVEKGDLDVRVDLKNLDEIGDLGKYFNQMLDRLNEYMEQIIKKQKQLRTTEIKMLQAQIKPHFIYNTLDVIKWSVKLGRQNEAVSVTTNLARLLRFSIDNVEEFVTVRSNMEFINSYIAIQKIKYNNSFEVVMDIEERLMAYKIPRLVLQPFIENSIVHGFGKINKNGGLITIKGRFEECCDDTECKIIELIVEDNGTGMTQQEISELNFERSENHIGIYNVNRRIKMYFGESYGVTISSSKEKGTKVTVRIPSDLVFNIKGVKL